MKDWSIVKERLPYKLPGHGYITAELVTYESDNAQYIVVSGTHYPADTPPDLIAFLKAHEHSYEWTGEAIRLTFIYRYEDGEEWTQSGYIGRTTGRHAPIVVNNKRSMGGDLVLFGDNFEQSHLVEIKAANKMYSTRSLWIKEVSHV